MNKTLYSFNKYIERRKAYRFNIRNIEFSTIPKKNTEPLVLA